ncbi:hypothetical protein TcCL_ESM11933 [Trypanosoma cruzi]|nr:hypothetical protein TcCL_ESM11933 [Trypanosoma cruzi]
MLNGGAHVACGGFSCCWFVNVFFFFAFAETPQRAVSADSRALRGGASHDFWRDEAAFMTLRCLFSGLRGYSLLECIVGDHPRVFFFFLVNPLEFGVCRETDFDGRFMAVRCIFIFILLASG